MTFQKFSQHDHLACLDIETVPDRDLIPDWGEKFAPKVIWHRVVAISVVHAAIEKQPDGSERYLVKCCRTGGEADWDEQRLLKRFWESYFPRLKPRLITWNGKAFDMPVLRARSMIYGINASMWYLPGNRWDSYTQRFAPDWHCDLMEQMSDYRACTNMGLNDMAHALGLPGKVGGHGSEVDGMVKRGEIAKVRDYCESDVLNLFVLYVRWALLTGRTDLEGHNASLESLVQCLESERADRPHLGEFLDRWRATNRPAPMFLPAMSLNVSTDTMMAAE
jgi:3'-5' exonuclease